LLLKVYHTLVSLDKVLKGESDDDGDNSNDLDKQSKRNKHVSTIEIYEQSHRCKPSRVSPVDDDTEVEQYVIFFFFLF